MPPYSVRPDRSGNPRETIEDPGAPRPSLPESEPSNLDRESSLRKGERSGEMPETRPEPLPRNQKTLDDFDQGENRNLEARDSPPEDPTLPAGSLLVAEPGGFLEHPRLRPGTVRAYPFQLSIARSCLEASTLVVLPTGLGKSVIAALVAAERLRTRSGKVLFLAPTRPLVVQHARSFQHWFRRLSRAIFTGTVSSPRREGAWDPSDIVFATPQVVANDLRDGVYSLRDVGLIIFDEAHRAVGRYAYVEVASIYRLQREGVPLVLGLTASPGGRELRIREVLANLGVARVEARSEADPDVQGFRHAVETEHLEVRLPEEHRRVRELLRQALHGELVRLQRMGFLRKKPLRFTGVRDLLETRGAIMGRPGALGWKFGAMYHLMLAIHLQHAGELLETQGVRPFLDYLDRVRDKHRPGRADRAFLALPAIRQAREILSGGLSGPSHPKLPELLRVVQETLASNPQARILVFAQFRDTIREVVESLIRAGIDARRFVGQATRSPDDPGMNQKEQVRCLEEFRAGRFPVLVASSVAEEGLDIPNVDLVVLFEAQPSEIRTIQRRGRTGRNAPGRVVTLLATGTRDIGYQRAERKRESAMRRQVRRLSRKEFSSTSEPPSPPKT